MNLEDFKKTKKISTKTGMTTLMGVLEEPPVDHGNRFSFAEPEAACANMFKENLDALVEDGTLEDETIEIDLYEFGDNEVAVVVDERVPEEYLNGGATLQVFPKNEVFEEMIDHYEWNREDFLKTLDPEAWADKKKGRSVKESDGMRIFEEDVETGERCLEDELEIDAN